MALDSPRLQAQALRTQVFSLGPRRFGRVNWLGLATLYRREMRRLQKDYIDSLLGPALTNLLFMLIFKLAAGGQDARAGGLPLADFVAPGLLMYAAGERAFSGACSSLIFDKLEGIIGDIIMAPLNAGERLAAFAAAAVSAGLVSALATAAVLWPFAHLAFAAPAALVYFFIAGTLLLALLGILAGLWAQRWDHYAALLTYFLIPFSYLSGMFYSTDGLPALGHWLIAANPLYYIIDGLRFGLTGLAETEVWPGALLILVLDLFLGVLIYRLFRRGWRIKS
jgi:ABC-2 type transport system permease protein